MIIGARSPIVAGAAVLRQDEVRRDGSAGGRPGRSSWPMRRRASAASSARRSARWPRCRRWSRAARGRWSRRRRACGASRPWWRARPPAARPGENILARALCQLPPDLLEINVAVGNKVVEYALRLPGGRFLPIDSKWTERGGARSAWRGGSVAERQAAGGAGGARRCARAIREMAKYLDPERTSCLGLLAVPDARLRRVARGARRGVPRRRPGRALLAGAAVRARALPADAPLRLRRGHRPARGAPACPGRGARSARPSEVESRLSRALVLLENARDALRAELGRRRGAPSAGLLDSRGGGAAPSARYPRLTAA